MRLRLFHIALLVPTLLVPMHALAQGRAAVVLVDTVDQREIRDTQSVIGQLVATQRSEIATRTEGVIEAVTFEVGEHVKKGQTLVTLDKSRFEIEKRAAEASMDVARAGLRIAEAKLKLAELAFSRQEGLRKSTAFSRSRYDDLKQAAVQSRSERSQAEAQILNAQSSLNRALYDLKHAVIVAPFDGVVIERQAQPGQYMNTGNAVATILDVRNLEVEADVPSNIVNGLTIGSKVTAVFEGDVRKSVTIRTAIPVQNVSTRTRPVRFTAKLDSLNASMVAIGSSVTLQLPVSAPRKVISVPKDALLQGRGGWMVYVVTDNKAQPRPVKLGQAVQARIEILSGISVGDVVVVRGNERLRPGQAVRAKHVKAKTTNSTNGGKQG